MGREELLELIEALGREFDRRGMRAHVEGLRVYYLAVRHGLHPRPERDGRTYWSEPQVLEWMAMLRLPPYRDRYPLRSRGYRCPCSASSALPSGRSGDWSHIGKGATATEVVFPGGAKIRCTACGERWIEGDEVPPREDAAAPAR